MTPQKSSQELILILIAASAIVFISMGLRQSFGLFMQPMVCNLGWGRETFSLAMAVQNLVLGLPIAGYLADRFDPRKVVFGGGLIYILAMVLMPDVESGGYLIFVLGFLAGIAQSATTFVVVLGAVGRVVSAERRATAFGVITALGSGGMFALIPVTNHYILNEGWGAGFDVLALLCGGILLCALFLPGKVKDSGTDSAEPAPGFFSLIKGASSHSGYVLLTAGFFVCGFHVAFIATHLAAYAVDEGLSREAGATALAMIGLFNIFGSITFGWLGDRYRKRTVLAWLYGLRAIVISGFLVVPVTEFTAILFGCLIGFVWLATVPITSGMVGHLFGPRYMGTLYGTVFLGHQLGAFLGVWWGGYMFDTTGSYDLVWWSAVGLSLLAAVMHLFLDDQPRKTALSA